LTIDLVYLVFALASLASFRVWRPPVAALVVFLGGWLLLPVGHFPAGSASTEFPYRITGLAVPSDMLPTKAWLAPAAVVMGRSFSTERPGARCARCGWTCQSCCGAPGRCCKKRSSAKRIPRRVASLYLVGCWGLPWLLGQLYFSMELPPAAGQAVASLMLLAIWPRPNPVPTA
jgi:hypothetical protein